MMKRLRILPLVTLLYLVAVYLVRYMNGTDLLLSLIDSFIHHRNFLCIRCLLDICFSKRIFQRNRVCFKSVSDQDRRKMNIFHSSMMWMERKETHEVYAVKEPLRMTEPLFYIGDFIPCRFPDPFIFSLHLISALFFHIMTFTYE